MCAANSVLVRVRVWRECLSGKEISGCRRLIQLVGPYASAVYNLPNPTQCF